MDLNVSTEQFIRGVTETLINSMTTEIRNQVVQDVTAHVMNFDLQSEVQNQIDSAVARAIESYSRATSDGRLDAFANNPVTNSVFTEFKSRTDAFLETLIQRVHDRVIADMNYKLNSVDIASLVREQADLTVKHILSTHIYDFPDASIPGRSINPEGIAIKPESILPGIIKKFESTGIQDFASRLQLTILDDAIIMENKLVAHDLDVMGSITVRGEINKEFTDNLVTEVVQKFEAQYEDGVYDQYTNRVLTRLYELGIESTLVKVDGESVIVGQTLSNKVTESNLQKLGALRSLYVDGESLLDNTVYVSSRRLGINTREPERVLDIWDQEVQIVAAKRMKDVGFIGTLRSQQLILSSNNKDNLILHPDGSISISQMTLGRIHHSSAAERPMDNRPLGQIVWNERPTVGGPIGWVSLGGARWAKFGIVADE